MMPFLWHPLRMLVRRVSETGAIFSLHVYVSFTYGADCKAGKESAQSDGLLHQLSALSFRRKSWKTLTELPSTSTSLAPHVS